MRALPVFLVIVDKKDLLLTSLRARDFGAVTELKSGVFAHSEFLGSFLSDLLGFTKK